MAAMRIVQGLLHLLQACNDFASLMEDSEDDSDSSQTTLPYSSTSVSPPASLKACDPLQTHSEVPDYKSPTEDLGPETVVTAVLPALPIPSEVCPSSSSKKVKTKYRRASNLKLLSTKPKLTPSCPALCLQLRFLEKSVHALA